MCSNVPGHMIKMASMPIYGKNLNKFLLWNLLDYVFETWYTALVTRIKVGIYIFN